MPLRWSLKMCVATILQISRAYGAPLNKLLLYEVFLGVILKIDLWME